MARGLAAALSTASFSCFRILFIPSSFSPPRVAISAFRRVRVRVRVRVRHHQEWRYQPLRGRIMLLKIEYKGMWLREAGGGGEMVNLALKDPSLSEMTFFTLASNSL